MKTPSSTIQKDGVKRYFKYIAAGIIAMILAFITMETFSLDAAYSPDAPGSETGHISIYSFIWGFLLMEKRLFACDQVDASNILLVTGLTMYLLLVGIFLAMLVFVARSYRKTYKTIFPMS